MQQQDISRVFETSRWLYDQYTESWGYGVIHIPLLYQSRTRINHELYAAALGEYPFLVELEHCFPVDLIDGAVIKFPLQNLEFFREKCFDSFANQPQILAKFFKYSLFIKKHFPKLCIKAEKQFLQNKKVSPVLLKRLFRMIARLISINLSNPFIELIFLRLNNSYQDNPEYQEMVNKIIWTPIFSHLSFFSNEKELLKKLSAEGNIKIEHILEFCWSKGFLGNSLGDKSEFELPEFVASSIGMPELTDNSPSKFIDINQLKLPDINFDPTGLTESWEHKENGVENILYFMRILLVNEEFRHYWGLRLVRLFRLLTPDTESIENWGINEYEQYFKI